MKNDRLYLRINHDLKTKIEQLAKEQNRTVSNLIETILKKEIEKREGNINMNKVKEIYELVEKIQNLAIENYKNQINCDDFTDWENGYKTTFRNHDGKIVDYISYNDFKSLYYNLTQTVTDKTNTAVLNKVIEYLEKELQYIQKNVYSDKIEYYNLDSELYTIDYFEEIMLI